MIPSSVRSFFKPTYQRFSLRKFTAPTFTTLHSADITVSLNVDPTNGAVDEYIFIHHQWEEEVAQVLADHLHQGAVFVDVGANIGAFTIPLAKKVTDTGKVVSFEPLPKLIHQVEKSLARNELSNVSLINKACGAEVGTQDLYVQAENIGGSSLIKKTAGGEKISLTVTTLDKELAALEKIDLIKIDVEGYELEVLQGAECTLRKHHPALVIEFSPSLYQPRSETMSLDILQLLITLGYRIWEIERGFYVDDVSGYLEEIGSNQVNILCTTS